LAARIIAKQPGLTPWQVKTVLRAVARNVREQRQRELGG
jgi:hypothetical protein